MNRCDLSGSSFLALSAVLAIACQRTGHSGADAQTGDPPPLCSYPAEEPTTTTPAGPTAGKLLPSEAAILTDDPQHVDLVDLISQAKAFAARTDTRLELVALHAREVVGGTIDVTSVAGATYTFEYEGLDSTQPPGKDRISMGLWVLARQGRLSRMTLPKAIHRLPNGRLQMLPPPCPSRKAWATAVAAGVPENAVARFSYRVSFQERQPMWEIAVDGHPELERSVDPTTCKLVQTAASVAPTGRVAGSTGGVRDPWPSSPQAAPTAPPPSPSPKLPSILPFPSDPYPP